MTLVPDAPRSLADRIDLEPLPLAVVRHAGLRLDDLRSVFDAGFSALGRAFAGGALTPTSPAIAIYRGDPQDVFDLELGFVVTAAPRTPIVDRGTEITASALPAGPALATTHVGDYDGLGEAWGSLVAEGAEQGAGPAGVWIEIYVTDPSNAEDELRTDLIMPIAG
ncbi:GyrI-like domain-containing protein [Microbacterium sp. No. 7]|uniref:GyrI-like domain-containing protein n=1 Tax=Microbacterium sp. No. 7 TaxID=1714373 RepID=UPI0006D1E435|nr:GyrI-like domain-containing protein [Microbacterium sp. No. 7]